MKIEFDTRPFVRSHGKEPRGRGSWAFGPTEKADANDCVFSPGGMTLTEAKRWFAAKMPDAQLAYVMP